MVSFYQTVMNAFMPEIRRTITNTFKDAANAMLAQANQAQSGLISLIS
jgi:hypothetical protein